MKLWVFSCCQEKLSRELINYKLIKLRFKQGINAYRRQKNK
ncbi:hypothetical protein [Crocosphaera watsonii]|uniref:Uncharacterized protein n=1 Tax=Crocosphaera watsonii WH 0401 TaxID=555881 RepID=T2J7W9_CROWT|nr:hypothetical protein [Crocosphaera watsonii]CCQ61260.1 hypothetical protein CWATWH0401_2457 [Crocosphaera watsonii WH 0401]